jgi:aryl-alcohol dehydrogenase-like predicted oxidoreductase
VEGSLRRLETDYIDLFQLHGFDAMTPIEEVLQTLDDLVRAGKIRYIGCSNFSGWHLMKSLADLRPYGWRATSRIRRTTRCSGATTSGS